MEYGLIGGKLSHSFSVPIHNAFASYSYELCPMPPEALTPFFAARAFRGVNVTIPYKRDVIPFCDVLSPEAEAIGSVNTIVNRQGRLYGYNTDIYGFLYLARRQGISFDGKKTVILGSGGTSHTVRAAAEQAGAREIVVVSRSGEDNYENLSRHADGQILVNTTPVGMFPDNGKKPVELFRFPCCEGVLDAIYNPLSTALVLEAREKGIPASGGLMMLVAQAKRACELFTDAEISDRKTEEVYRALLARMSNLVLVGSQKDDLGGQLAQALGLEFFDTAQWLTRSAGRSEEEILRDEGENGLRTRVREACAEAGKKTGCVIAVDSSALDDERNLTALQGNGILLFLRTSDTDAALPCCQLALDCSGSVEDTVRKGKEIYAEIFGH